MPDQDICDYITCFMSDASGADIYVPGYVVRANDPDLTESRLHNFGKSYFNDGARIHYGKWTKQTCAPGSNVLPVVIPVIAREIVPSYSITGSGMVAEAEKAGRFYNNTEFYHGLTKMLNNLVGPGYDTTVMANICRTNMLSRINAEFKRQCENSGYLSGNEKKLRLSTN